MTVQQKRSRTVTGATKRAKEMMVGGLVLGHVVGLTVIGLALAIGGADGAVSAALGFAAVVIFFSVGQFIEIIACELEPVQGMGLALVSYLVRVVGIGVGMYYILYNPAVAPHVEGGWLLLSMVATVIAWVGGVVLVASRQRVPIYDAEYVPPAAGGEGD